MLKSISHRIGAFIPIVPIAIGIGMPGGAAGMRVAKVCSAGAMTGPRGPGAIVSNLKLDEFEQFNRTAESGTI